MLAKSDGADAYSAMLVKSTPALLWHHHCAAGTPNHTYPFSARSPQRQDYEDLRCPCRAWVVLQGAARDPLTIGPTNSGAAGDQPPVQRRGRRAAWLWLGNAAAVYRG